MSSDPSGLDSGPGDPAPRSGIARASAILASGTVVSRVLGFVSAALLAQALGITGSGADTFRLANQLPNNIYALVAGGVLSAVIVPHIVRAHLHEDGGAKFINRLVTLGGVVFIAAAVIATACAPLLVRLYAQSGTEGFDQSEFGLATAFAYWCLPQILFYALYSLAGEVLNARGVFGPFTWAPALNNVVAITGLIVFIALFGGDPAHVSAESWTGPQITLLAGSATLGIAAQAFVLFLFWRKAGLKYRPDFRWRGVGLGATGQAAAWVFGMILVTQFAGIVQANVASSASGFASFAVLFYGWLIFMLPHGIITVSIATAYFTRMSGHARDGDIDALRTDVAAALRAILLFMVFSTVGLMVLAFPFAAVFDSDPHSGVLALGLVLISYLAGLIPFTILFVLQRVFYALGDTRTPFFLQLGQSVLFAASAFAVWGFVPAQWRAVGLALALSFASTLQTTVAAILLSRKTRGLDAASVWAQSGWFALSAVLAGAAGTGVLVSLGGVGLGAFPVDSQLGGILTMLLGGTVMVVVYFGFLWLVHNPELRAMLAPVLARLRRSG